MIKRLNALKLAERSWHVYVLILAIFFGLICISSLRSNYRTMTKLREQVVLADQNNGDTETALKNLREHVYGHMNTNLTSGSNPIKPPIQLKGRYDRLMAAQQEQIKAQNAKIADQGAIVCGQKYPASGFNPDRVACLQQYVSDNAVNDATIADDLYKFDFVSPKWSPDLAGISMVISAVLFVAYGIGLGIKLVKKNLDEKLL